MSFLRFTYLILSLSSIVCQEVFGQENSCEKDLKLISSIREAHFTDIANHQILERLPSSLVSTMDPSGGIFTLTEYSFLSETLNDRILTNADSLCDFYKILQNVLETTVQKRIHNISGIQPGQSDQHVAEYCLLASNCLARSDELLNERISSQIALNYQLQLRDSTVDQLTAELFYERVKKKMIRDLEYFLTKSDPSSLMINAVAGTMDPHTNYFTGESAQLFRDMLDDDSEGYGFEVRENYLGEFYISTVTPGTSVWREPFVKSGARLKSISFCGQKSVQAYEITYRELRDMLDDRDNNCLNIELLNDDREVRSFSFERESIDQYQSNVSSLILGEKLKIGYIPFKSFYSDADVSGISGGSAADFTYELMQIKRESVQGLIIDLRNNSGGSVFEALEIAGVLINEGALAYAKIRDETETMRDRNRGRIFSQPVIVLMNSSSASASELLAGILKDKGVAIIAGGKSFGKGSMQQIYSVNHDGSIGMLDLQSADTDLVKVTEGVLSPLSGQSYQEIGIVPDIELDLDLITVSIREEQFPNHLPVQKIITDATGVQRVDSGLIDQMRANHRALFSETYEQVEAYRDSLPIAMNFLGNKLIIALKDSLPYTSSRRKPDIVLSDFSLTINYPKHRLVLLDTYGQSSNDIEYLDELAKDLYIQASYNLMLDFIQLTNQDEH